MFTYLYNSISSFLRRPPTSSPSSPTPYGFIPLLCGDEHRGSLILETFFDTGLESYFAEHVQSHQCWISRIQYCTAVKEPRHEFILLHINWVHSARPFGYIFVNGDREGMPMSDVAHLFRLRIPSDSIVASVSARPPLGPTVDLTPPDEHAGGKPIASVIQGTMNSAENYFLESHPPKAAGSLLATPRAVLLGNVDINRAQGREYTVLSDVSREEHVVPLSHFIAAGRVASEAALEGNDLVIQRCRFLHVFGHLLSEDRLLHALRHGESVDSGDDQETMSLQVAADDLAPKQLSEYVQEIQRLAELKPLSERRKELEEARARAEAAENEARMIEARLAEDAIKRQVLEERVRQMEQQLEIRVSSQLILYIFSMFMFHLIQRASGSPSLS